MARLNNIKAVIVDLDRTLLHTNKTISSYTAKILTECKKNGIKIMVATARPLRTTREFCDIIDFDAMVVSNGARIICNNKRTEYGICQSSAVNLLNLLKEHSGLRITLETGDIAYSNVAIDDYETIICNDLAAVAEAEGVLKLIVGFDYENTLEIVKNILTDDLYYSVANGHLIQIMDKSATKWNGIKSMLNIMKCLPEDSVYFGDDFDDIEPIKMCGTGVAVSNGIDQVKSAADYIADSNDEDGVARFIEQIILNK